MKNNGTEIEREENFEEPVIVYDVWNIDTEEFVGTATDFRTAKNILGDILFFGANTRTEVAFREHSKDLKKFYANQDWPSYYKKLKKVYIEFRKQNPRQLSQYWYRTHIVIEKKTTYVTTEGRFELTEGIE